MSGNDEIIECPKCKGTLDVGGECNDCDFDLQPIGEKVLDYLRNINEMDETPESGHAHDILVIVYGDEAMAGKCESCPNCGEKMPEGCGGTFKK